jgi:hypothetical protein
MNIVRSIIVLFALIGFVAVVSVIVALVASATQTQGGLVGRNVCQVSSPAESEWSRL